MSEQQTQAGEPDMKAILLELLKGAAAAHGVHEKQELGGVYDQNWPEWYAQHMTRALAEAGYKISRS